MLTLRCFSNPCLFRHPPKQRSTPQSAGYGFLSSFTEKNKTLKTQLEAVSSHKIREEHAGNLVGRDFLNLQHFSSDDIKQFLWTAKDLKTRMKDNSETYQPLMGKTAALILQKQCPQLKLSAELGMAKLGGHVCFLGPDDIHLGVTESVKDSARVLAGMADIILAGVKDQGILVDLANESKVPVISGFSDLFHPLQILADFMTLQEYFGYLRGMKIAWIGGGSNVLHSLMDGCAKIGIDLNVATPAGYEPDPNITEDTMKMAVKNGASFQFGHDPIKAAYRADVIVTDSWISSEQEEEKKRLQDFAGYRINRKMLKDAGGDWVLLHSQSRHKGEVTDDILYSKESLVWQEAENKMWIVMAVMLHLLQPYKPIIPKPKYVRG